MTFLDNHTMLDDIASIRKGIEELVEAGKEICCDGGFVGIFFLAAGIALDGFKHQPLPKSVYDIHFHSSTSEVQN